MTTPFLERFTFDSRYAFHLGAEEEIWTVDPGSGLLVPASERLFNEIPEGRIRPELPIHQVECVTGICPDVNALLRDVQENRWQLGSLGQRHGFALNFSSMPPSDFEVCVYPKPRYLAIAAQIPPERLRNGWIAGLHVHVGCRSLEHAIVLLNGLREDLPFFLALSLRRPLRHPEDHTRCSERFFRYLEMCPNLVPPVLHTVEGFDRVAEEQGFWDDPKRCWWGVRINPLGTVEVRVFEMQQDPEQVAQLATFVLARARMHDRCAQWPRTRSRADIRRELELVADRPMFDEGWVSTAEQTLAFARVSMSSQDQERLLQLFARWAPDRFLTQMRRDLEEVIE